MFSPPPPKPKKRAVVIGAGIVGITTARALYSTNLYDVVVLEKGPNPLSFNSAGNAGLVRRSSWAGLAGPSTLHHALFSFRQQASNLVGLGGRGGDGEGGSTPYLVFRPWALATAPGGIGWGMSFLKHCLFGVKERDEWLKKFTINAVGATETLGDRVGYTLHKGAFGLWGGGGSAPVNDGVRVEMGRRLPGDKGGEGEGGGKMRWPGHLNSFYLPDDLNGDCVDFGKAIIKSGGGEWGVKCEWEAVGVRMVGEGRGGRGRGGGEGREKVAAVVCVDGREEECDVLVLCDAGRGGVIKPPAPVWPVWGYSVEFVRPKGWGNDPVFDQESMIVVAPHNNRIRITGFAQVGGKNKTNEQRQWCFDVLRNYGKNLGLEEEAKEGWGGGEELQKEQEEKGGEKGWFGFRPCAPDGVPLVGRDERYENVWWNVGHGAMGFRVAAETADHLGRVMGGGRPKEGYERFLDPMRFLFWR